MSNIWQYLKHKKGTVFPDRQTMQFRTLSIQTIDIVQGWLVLKLIRSGDWQIKYFFFLKSNINETYVLKNCVNVPITMIPDYYHYLQQITLIINIYTS